ncbi:hypothetical protein THRCLA_23066, partial [Thraustotheca clavata]
HTLYDNYRTILTNTKTIWSDNGFVDGVVVAYCGHHNITICPGYLNQGQKELVVVRNGSLYTIDFGDMAVEMVDYMNANLIDASLGQSILPSFIILHDTIAGSVVKTASIAKYFRYKFEFRCGVSYMNLLGTVGIGKKYALGL